MIGAIVGDVVGSRFEGMKRFPKSQYFSLVNKKCRVTDDSILTIATAEAILYKKPYKEMYQKYFDMFPHAGYGSSFKNWAINKLDEPYNSWGNGSAMRVSPVGWAFDDEEEVFEEAKKTAEVTHNHIEGVKGAQSVALAIFYARNKLSKKEIESKISYLFNYDLRPPINPVWDVSCQGCVPQAFSAFLESQNFVDCIRKAIFKGGDSDTIAAIAGSIAEPYYGIPNGLKKNVMKNIPYDVLPIVHEFSEIYQKISNSNYIFLGLEKLFSDLI